MIHNLPGTPAFGTAEHAAMLTEGRHPGVRDALQWLTYLHLPEQLRIYSAIFYSAAVDLVSAITTDSPELTTALNRLIEAKDSAVRAGIRHDTGRAGSVSRPQTVVAPPYLKDPAPELNPPEHRASSRGGDGLGYGPCVECGELWPCMPSRS